MRTLIHPLRDPLLVCSSGPAHAPVAILTIFQFTGSPSQHYYSGPAGYENHPLPHLPPNMTVPPHFHHVSHYHQPQLGSEHVYPHLSQPAPHRPSDSTINFTPLPPTQDSGESRIPLLTMLTRPAPPEQSAPVNGYRDVAAALSTNPSNPQIIFGRKDPSVPSTELVVNVVEENTGKVSIEPRLPSFTVGVSREDPTVTTKSRECRNTPKTNDPVGEPSIGVIDRTNPEVAFQFGSLPSADATPGPSSGPAGSSDQAAPVELDSLKSDTGDEWQVRDFGYGFGHMSGTGNAAAVVREEIHAREQRRAQERRHREEQERRQKEEQEREASEPSPDQVRRGSLNGGNERGAYPGRRGRGLNGGYGRGYGRSFSRGGYGQYPARPPHQYSPTPPGQSPQLPSHTAHGYSPDQSVYFLPPPPPPPPNFGPYHPGGYEVYQYPSFPPPPALYPPVPHPVSQLPFPLDHTRYYLLGQLEYYLSPQNMAQDFYLRQQASPSD